MRRPLGALRLASALVCAAAGIALFQFWGNATHGYIATNSLFYWWSFQWVNPASETQHAWLILALSLFLFRRNLSLSAATSDVCDKRAAGAMGAGLIVHALGYIAQQPRVSIVALLLFTWGSLSLAGGRRWSRASAFPVAFMVFAIPVSALDTIGFWLQMWVVQAGEHIARAGGIGVVRNGTQLFAPDGRYQYDVVAACSGIRSLMALTALSLFIGYVWFKPLWLRCSMFLASFPLVYGGNVVRITAIIFAAQWRGQAWGDHVHDVMGFGVFIIVLGGVIACAELVARFRPGWTMQASVRPEQATGAASQAYPTPVPTTVLVVMAILAETVFLAHRASLHPVEDPGVVLSDDGTNPAELPTFLGSDWMGHHVEPEAIERSILPPDTGFSRKLYVNLGDPNQHVLLSIVLSGRDRTSIHRPELCLVGQGWTIDRASSHHFEYPAQPAAGFDATVLSVHRVVAGARGRQSVPELVVYWFVEKDRVVASQSGRMFYDAWSRVTRGRAPRWSYVFLQTGSRDGEAAGLARMQTVLDTALPAFQPARRGGN